MKLNLSFFFLFLRFTIFSQVPNSNKPPQNWYLLDLEKDGIPGISVEKVYETILKNKKPKQLITVAVIDCGIDITHLEISNVIWKNKYEIPNNNIDDDKNGLIDDINGWNFVGKIQGSTIEAIREYIRIHQEYETEKDSTILKQKKEFSTWQRIVNEKNIFFEYPKVIGKRVSDYENLITYYNSTFKETNSLTLDFLKEHPVPTTESTALQNNYTQRVEALENHSNDKSMTLQKLLNQRKKLLVESLETVKWAEKMIQENDINYFHKQVKYENIETNYFKSYGNNNMIPLEDHGTSCAGVIGASRTDSVGMKGITNNILIMPIRIFHKVNSDEVDKDVANAIYYAVNNGAKIINMSFGKHYSPQKKFVDKALLFAEKKGVLIVTGAGNDSSNNDSLPVYPSKWIATKRIASNIITVGASNSNSNIVCSFSNFGKKSVDVFAPGEDIYTTSLEHSYVYAKGTSFAAPMVSGLGALLWSFYPKFSYKQIKYCIEKSVKPIDKIVINPETQKQAPFYTLCKKGGIINAYDAFKIAQKISKQREQ